MIRHLLLSLILVFEASGCSYTKRVNDGQSAYDAKQYVVATEFFEKEYNTSSDRSIKARKAYLLAKSFQYMNDYVNSREWYQVAVNHDYGVPAMMGLANSHKLNKAYDKAIDVYRKIEQKNGKQNETTREINICRQAMNWLERDDGLQIEVKQYKYNSEYSDYAPVLYEDGYVVFSSDRMISTGQGNYQWTGNRFSDIYIASKSGGDVKLFGAGVNTENNEATIAFNKDFTEIFFTRCYSDEYESSDDYCRIMYSKYEEENWSEPIPLAFQDSTYNYGQPTLIENDSVLVFVSQTDDGYGGHDLYYSVRDDGGWTHAEPMPNSINTQGNEKFPTSDGDTLYFSSDYLPGLGGLDIFKTYLLDDGRWSPPKNLKYPFNSSTDDFGLVVDRTDTRNSHFKGYFSSSRNYETEDDIFQFIAKKAPESEIEKEVETEEVEGEVTYYLAIKAVYNLYEEADNPSSKLMGKEALENCTILLSSRGYEETFSTDSDGRLITKVEGGKNYKLIAKKTDYFNGLKDVNVKKIKAKQDTSVTINVEVALNKLVVNKEIVLENIYYDFDKWDIRSDAKPSLDVLGEIIKANPQLVIQLGSHTDCQGNDAYNQNLSQKRAQAAILYMKSKGVPIANVRAKGYGEIAPVIKCDVCNDCDESEHQANRRTTFKILQQ